MLNLKNQMKIIVMCFHPSYFGMDMNVFDDGKNTHIIYKNYSGGKWIVKVNLFWVSGAIHLK